MTVCCTYPDLCDQCRGTVHDPDVVTGRANLDQIRHTDHAYAEQMQLEPGDHVDSDGTIVRVDEDDYEARLRASIARPIQKLAR